MTYRKSTGIAVRAGGLTKHFGRVIALDEVDLTIDRATIHGIVGPNGAGKTTLLSLVLGLAQPSAGSLEVLGEPVRAALSVPRSVNGFVDAPGLYPSLTARNNLVQLARLQPHAGHAHVDQVLHQVGLTDVADDPVRGFSLGMRQRLGLAAALLTRPRLLVMDEPSNGLDPAGRAQVQTVLRCFADQGGTVVLSSHRMDDLSQLCDRVSLLAGGRVVFDGTVSELAEHSPELDMRLVTTDPRATSSLVTSIDGLQLRTGVRALPGELVVRGSRHRMDELVRRLASEGIALRELTPLVPPLEAAFLTLTGDGDVVPTAQEHAA